jgi:hypothetical protein
MREKNCWQMLSLKKFICPNFTVLTKRQKSACNFLQFFWKKHSVDFGERFLPCLSNCVKSTNFQIAVHNIAVKYVYFMYCAASSFLFAPEFADGFAERTTRNERDTGKEPI